MLLAAAAFAGDDYAAVDPARPNILLVLADDMGVDKLAAYGEHPSPGKTPVLDALAAHGVLFRNAWSQPVCSPTRATLLTGRPPSSTGVGTSIKYESDAPALLTPEPTLPELLRRRRGYRTAVVGKWHLSTEEDGGPLHPITSGFERHLGTIDSFSNADGLDVYTNWTKNVADARGAAQVPVTRYATTENVDDALAVIDDFGAEPWFVWLAFNAPHAPFHKPPADLHDIGLSGVPALSPGKHVKAAVQALDTELGRLLASLRPEVLANTTVVFAGDNGTIAGALQAPWPADQGKATVFESGVRVPLLVAGAGVAAPPGSECTALVTLGDLYATLAVWSGLDPADLPHAESRDLSPCLLDPRSSGRPWLFTERFVPTGLAGPHEQWRRAARDERYKLHRVWALGQPTEQQLYDLSVDPLEQDDLLQGRLDASAAEALERLSQVIDRSQASLPGVPAR